VNNAPTLMFDDKARRMIDQMIAVEARYLNVARSKRTAPARRECSHVVRRLIAARSSLRSDRPRGRPRQCSAARPSTARTDGHHE